MSLVVGAVVARTGMGLVSSTSSTSVRQSAVAAAAMAGVAVDGTKMLAWVVRKLVNLEVRVLVRNHA